MTMIQLNRVTDAPLLFGTRHELLVDSDLSIPQGRYALLSRRPEFHRALIDLIAGLRPPRIGLVEHYGLVSWPTGRQGFVRGKATGLRMIEFICAAYGIEPKPCVELVGDLLTSPEYLARRMEDWPLYMRQEFSFALALAPDFDVYIIEGAIPFEPCRFTRLWLALFEERLVGRTLLLSTYRQNQMSDYCTRGLIYEQNGLRIEDDIDECIRRFPVRRSRNESNSAGEEQIDDDVGGEEFDL